MKDRDIEISRLIALVVYAAGVLASKVLRPACLACQDEGQRAKKCKEAFKPGSSEKETVHSSSDRVF